MPHKPEPTIAPDASVTTRCPPGFRFSFVDGVVLAIASFGTMLQETLGSLAWLPVILVGHFFLFCNVFRIRRSYELIWAAVFVINLAGWSLAGAFSWKGVLLVQTPLTAAVIVAEITGGRYHGVGWSFIGRGGP